MAIAVLIQLERLNRDAVPCPRGKRWAMTAIREMVLRPLYRGVVIYGRTRWEYRRGRKFKVRVPESEWIITEAPSLRIVPEDLWQAARERVERTRRAYLRMTGGKLYGRPETGVESNYLLSGFLVCGECGGGMHVILRSSQRGRRVLYFACNNWRVNHACKNSMSVRSETLDGAILKTLRNDTLTADVVEAVVTRTIELARLEPDEHAERRQSLQAEAERLTGAISNLTSAIEAGGQLATLVTTLKAREHERADVLARLESRARAADPAEAPPRAAGDGARGGYSDVHRARTG